MTLKIKILLALGAVFLIIQFFRPEKNTGSYYTANDITTVIDVPADVKSILERSCGDCHSNNTRNIWYMTVQPIGWWIAHHIDEGKHELNFSEFATYSKKKQAHKLEELAEMVQEHEMPLNSYLWMHKDAELSDADRKALIDWAMMNYKIIKGPEEEEKD